MKPTVEHDEMFPEGANTSSWETEDAPSGSGHLDVVGSERTVHADFYNDFGDLFDDEDLS